MPTIEEFQQLQAAVAGLTKRVQGLEERLAKSGSSSSLTLDSHHESAPVPAPPDWKPGGLETEIGAHWFNRRTTICYLTTGAQSTLQPNIPRKRYAGTSALFPPIKHFPVWIISCLCLR